MLKSFVEHRKQRIREGLRNQNFYHGVGQIVEMLRLDLNESIRIRPVLTENIFFNNELEHIVEEDYKLGKCFSSEFSKVLNEHLPYALINEVGAAATPMNSINKIKQEIGARIDMFIADLKKQVQDALQNSSASVQPADPTNVSSSGSIGGGGLGSGSSGKSGGGSSNPNTGSSGHRSSNASNAGVGRKPTSGSPNSGNSAAPQGGRKWPGVWGGMKNLWKNLVWRPIKNKVTDAWYKEEVITKANELFVESNDQIMASIDKFGLDLKDFVFGKIPEILKLAQIAGVAPQGTPTPDVPGDPDSLETPDQAAAGTPDQTLSIAPRDMAGPDDMGDEVPGDIAAKAMPGGSPDDVFARRHATFSLDTQLRRLRKELTEKVPELATAGDSPSAVNPILAKAIVNHLRTQNALGGDEPRANASTGGLIKFIADKAKNFAVRTGREEHGAFGNLHQDAERQKKKVAYVARSYLMQLAHHLIHQGQSLPQAIQNTDKEVQQGTVTAGEPASNSTVTPPGSRPDPTAATTQVAPNNAAPKAAPATLSASNPPVDAEVPKPVASAPTAAAPSSEVEKIIQDMSATVPGVAEFINSKGWNKNPESMQKVVVVFTGKEESLRRQLAEKGKEFAHLSKLKPTGAPEASATPTAQAPDATTQPTAPATQAAAPATPESPKPQAAVEPTGAPKPQAGNDEQFIKDHAAELHNVLSGMKEDGMDDLNPDEVSNIIRNMLRSGGKKASEWSPEDGREAMSHVLRNWYKKAFGDEEAANRVKALTGGDDEDGEETSAPVPTPENDTPQHNYSANMPDEDDDEEGELNFGNLRFDKPPSFADHQAKRRAGEIEGVEKKDAEGNTQGFVMPDRDDDPAEKKDVPFDPNPLKKGQDRLRRIQANPEMDKSPEEIERIKRAEEEGNATRRNAEAIPDAPPDASVKDSEDDSPEDDTEEAKKKELAKLIKAQSRDDRGRKAEKERKKKKKKSGDEDDDDNDVKDFYNRDHEDAPKRGEREDESFAERLKKLQLLLN